MTNQISKSRKIVSLILKGIVVYFALSGTYKSVMSNTDTFMGGTNTLRFFTIQSNIGLAIVCMIGMYFLLRNKDIPYIWYVIKFVATLSITLTGVVFCFVLAPTFGEDAWNTVNIYTHVIVPIAAVIDFFVTGIDTEIKKNSVAYVGIPPIIYAFYAGYGYIKNWEFFPGANYPYFFLNWGSPAGAFGFCNELPFMGCMWWILALLLFLIIMGLIYLVILDWIKKVVRK